MAWRLPCCWPSGLLVAGAAKRGVSEVAGSAQWRHLARLDGSDSRGVVGR